MKATNLTKTDFKHYIAGNILNTLYISKGKEIEMQHAKEAHQIAADVVEFAEKYGLLDEEFNVKP